MFPVPHHDPASISWPLGRRLNWVGALRRLVATRQDDLIEAMHADIAKPRFEGLVGDVAPLLAACAWVENHGARILKPSRLPGGGVLSTAVRGIVTRAPLGRVAIIATWNYPVQLLGIELVQAIAAGNRVTVKPSENAPRSQTLLLDLALEAGLETHMPDGWLTRTDASREAGASLLRDNAFDHVVFTGSTNVGRAIAETLAPRLTSSTLELSGRDSAFVLGDADPELAADALWNGITMNAGQTCMAPRRALVDEQIYAEFVRRLMARAGAARPLPLVNERAASEIHALALQAHEHGCRSLSGVVEPPVADSQGIRRLIRPMVFADCPRHATLIEGRHFGPLLAVVRVANLEDALTLHDSVDQVLATSVFTKDPSRVDAFRERLRSTIVTVNDCLTPTAHASVGLSGHGASGWGVTKGEEGLLAMTRPMYTTTTSPLLRFSMSTVTPAIEQGMAKFVRWWFGGKAPGQQPRRETASSVAVATPNERRARQADAASSHTGTA
jgi:aldehyde dehydrogenase (NAD+)